MNDLFNLSVFVDKVMEAQSLSSDNIHSHKRTLEVFDLFYLNEHATSELFSSFTYDELEWVFDLISYWPSAETDVEPEDLDHPGIQQDQIYDLVKSLSKIKSKKRKEIFI
ncbi:hypothetical protein KC480_05820 [Bacillus velezensis]|uniref:hypothetical protein n=1 Tax=Bacillus velezensis TaxID=492670 RepID=UPI001E51B269|nr:hypothetical protein [Bacillus velezensis]MCD7911042.1 hypothetical protein [Bacillus velezensis]